MVRTSLAEFKKWDIFAGLFVWLFWLDWGQLSSDVHLSLHISISLLCSQILCPSPSQAFCQPSQCCCRWSPSLSGRVWSAQHQLWPLKLELSELPHAVVWPVPDSPMTQQNTSCGCHYSRRRSNTLAGLEADCCPAVPWSLMSKDSCFWSLVCFAFVATHHANCSTCLVHTLSIIFFPIGKQEKEQCLNLLTEEQQSWLFSHLSDAFFSFPKTESRVLPPHCVPSCCLM